MLSVLINNDALECAKTAINNNEAMYDYMQKHAYIPMSNSVYHIFALNEFIELFGYTIKRCFTWAQISNTEICAAYIQLIDEIQNDEQGDSKCNH